MKFPIRTTSDSEFFRLHLRELTRGCRKFIWYHLNSPEQGECLRESCEKAGLVILETVDYFLLACSATVSLQDRKRMVEHVLPKESPEHAFWVGEQFGYSDREIAWYLEQLKKANRIRRKLENFII